MASISVIVTTYNRSDALRCVLKSLYAQGDRDFEIIIADDGSELVHQRSIREFIAGQEIVTHYVWQEDQGFRAGAVRNQAVAASAGEYLIFVDGDCIVLPDFVATHRRLAAPGRFVAGNRVLLTPAFSQQVVGGEVVLHRRGRGFLAYCWLRRRLNRLLPLLRLPLGGWRLRRPTRWQQVMSCNLAIWREDFVAVRGFDEAFTGWGHEDSELVVRLIQAGVYRKEGRFAVPVLHLWHPPQDRSQQSENWQRLTLAVGRGGAADQGDKAE